GQALAATGRGVFEVAEAGTGGRTAGDPPGAAEAEVAWMARLSASMKRPAGVLVLQGEADPAGWRALPEVAGEAPGARGGVAPRRFGMLAGHQSRVTPFADRPTYRTLASLPLAERVVRLRDREVRRRILAERPVSDAVPGTLSALLGPAMYPRLFPLGEPPD